MDSSADPSNCKYDSSEYNTEQVTSYLSVTNELTSNIR